MFKEVVLHYRERVMAARSAHVVEYTAHHTIWIEDNHYSKQQQNDMMLMLAFIRKKTNCL